MAIATSTALAIGSAVATAGGAAMSFRQAARQNGLMKKAEADAQLAMEEARKKLEINYYASLGINKEPYELAREASLASGAQAIQAGVESERGAAATAGRVQMAQNEAQAGIRTEMGKEIADLEMKTAEEQSRLRDVGAQLDLAEVEGNQQVAADAQKAAAAATAQGWQGVTSAIQQGISAVPLYMKDNEEDRLQKRAQQNMEKIGLPKFPMPSTKLVQMPTAQKPAYTVPPLLQANAPAYTAQQTFNPFDPNNQYGPFKFPR
jgi:hypothetical protein